MQLFKYINLSIDAAGFQQKEGRRGVCGRPDKTETHPEWRIDVAPFGRWGLAAAPRSAGDIPARERFAVDIDDGGETVRGV